MSCKMNLKYFIALKKRKHRMDASCQFNDRFKSDKIWWRGLRKLNLKSYLKNFITCELFQTWNILLYFSYFLLRQFLSRCVYKHRIVPYLKTFWQKFYGYQYVFRMYLNILNDLIIAQPLTLYSSNWTIRSYILEQDEVSR